jgi:AraC family transcriptional regulator
MERNTAPEADSQLLESTANCDSWRGIRFDVFRGPTCGELRDPEPSKKYWLSVIRNGKCDVRLQRGRTTKTVQFVPSSFAAYNSGVHWDRTAFEGVVETINFSFESTDPAFLNAMPELRNFHCAQDAVISALAHSMLLEVRQGCPSGRLYAESLSLGLASRLWGIGQESVGQTPTFAHPKLTRSLAERVAEFIEARLDEDLTISRLAGVVQMAESTFCICFKGSFGMPVHRYVLERRISRSRILLESDAPIAHIALECGFSSQSRFTEAFRKSVGDTPGKYRNDVRAKFF